MNPEERRFRIEGLRDRSDAIHVEKALNAVPDATVIVDAPSAVATVYAEPQVTDEALRRAAADAGWDVRRF